MGKSTINGPFKIAMLVCQRVTIKRRQIKQRIDGVMMGDLLHGKIGDIIRYNIEVFTKKGTLW